MKREDEQIIGIIAKKRNNYSCCIAWNEIEKKNNKNNK